MAAALGTSVEFLHVVQNLAVRGRWRVHAEAVLRDRVVATRQERELLIQGIACAVPTALRLETGVVQDRLADAATSRPEKAPLLVLGRKMPGAHGAAPGTIAYRVLSAGTVPVLMYIGP